MTVAEYLLPHWLAALRTSAPDTSVALTTRNSDDVAAGVLAGTALLGFIEGPDVPEGLTAAAVGHDVLTVIVAPTHPWARRRSGNSAGGFAAPALIHREPRARTRPCP